MYLSNYNNKVLDFINKKSIVKIDRDSTDKFQRNLKSIINKSKHLFSNDELKHERMINPSAPKVRGLPKIHKENILR